MVQSPERGYTIIACVIACEKPSSLLTECGPRAGSYCRASPSPPPESAPRERASSDDRLATSRRFRESLQWAHSLSFQGLPSTEEHLGKERPSARTSSRSW